MSVAAQRVVRYARYLGPLLWGRPLHGRERYRPFFIVGSGKCGTTLLRAMLEAHPAVHVPPENSLGDVVRDYRRYSRLPWGVVLRITLGAMEFRHRWERFGMSLAPLFRELQALPHPTRNLAAVLDALYRAHIARSKPSAVRWGDKTPGNVFALEALRAVFPDLKVIHLVRDGRDVVRSFMVATRENLPRAAARWLRAVRAGRAFGARHAAPYRELRFEDLVSRPGPMLEGIAGFLDIEFDARMLRHHELDLPLEDLRGLPYHENVRKPIQPAAVGRWRTSFDAGQIVELKRLLGPTLAALGYGDASV